MGLSIQENLPNVITSYSIHYTKLYDNLAGIRALQRSATVGSANAVIEGKAHRIDDDLYQYWVTITPVDPETDMTTLSADAYVRIPDRS